MVLARAAKLGLDGIFSGLRYRWMRYTNQPQMPTFLVFQLTNRCNSRCTICNIWQKSPKGELTKPDIEKIFQNKLWSELRWVNLTGGEPFLRDDLVDVCGMLGRLPKLEGIAIPSNGLMTQRIVDRTKKILGVIRKDQFLSVTLSIDGFEKTHDAIRGVPGGYRKVLATLKALQALKKEHANFNVGVQPTISRKNVDEIERFYRHIKKLSSSVGFAVCLTSEGYYDNKGADVSLDDDDRKKVARFFKKIIKNDPQYGFYYSKLIYMFETGHRDFGCLAGYLTVFMDPFGNMSPCPVLSANKRYAFGNARNGAYKQWHSKAAERIRHDLKSEKECCRCTMMCDFISFAKVEFIEHSMFMMMHPIILYRLMKKIRSEKNPYF